MNFFAMKAYMLENRGKCIRTACIILVLIIALSIYLINNLTDRDEIVIAEAIESEEADEIVALAVQEEVYIIIDIEGAVKEPGVKTLPEGSRVNDAVVKAGGLTEKADTMDVNLAAKLVDGDKVYIPSEKEQGQSSESTVRAGIVTNAVSGNTVTGDSSGSSGVLININTANSDQLQALSGVGPVTAQKIIDYREKSGGFKKIEDITKVSGIGAKTYEKLKDRIAV